MSNRKIAIVYDWIDKWGGAERVLLEIAKIYPEAEFYTSYYNPRKAPWAINLKIHTSFIQHLPSIIRNNRWLSAPFYPFAFESFDFNGFDLVISVTSSYAKSVITRPETKHICYLLTPTRFLWIDTKSRSFLGIFNKILNPYFNYLKKWDYIVARRPDKNISISKTVQKRLKDFYGLESQVIYPPFDTEYWKKIRLETRTSKLETRSNYYLVVSRLEPYKNVDVVIDTFNQLPDKKLVIIGTGSQKSYLKSKAGNNVKFIKDVTDSELAQYYQNATALIMMQEEDFGYTSLEAQFFGCPVIAYKKGGASETVIDHKTGILFDEQTPQSLLSAIKTYDRIEIELHLAIKSQGANNIEIFNKTNFIAQIINSTTK